MPTGSQSPSPVGLPTKPPVGSQTSSPVGLPTKG